MSDDRPVIAVIGATGAQGGAVAPALFLETDVPQMNTVLVEVVRDRHLPDHDPSC